MEISDQLNRPLSISKTPQKLICLVPSLTELLVELGLAYKLVGVTKFCVHPKNIRQEAQIIGGTKSVKYHKITQLQPDFILANKEENTPEIVSELEQNYRVYVSDISTIEDLIDLVEDLSLVFEIQTKANDFIELLMSKFEFFKKEISHFPSVDVAYFIWREPWMVAGHSNFINYMLQLCKMNNVYRHLSRYPEVDLANMPQLDYVLLSSEPFPFTEHNFPEIPLKSEQIKIVDGECFSWYGSRLIAAFDYLLKLRNSL
ncbi:helical backbone metal receptor [Psychroflexus sp. ALD_RP9]|uniref:helical backbone metal receptor n=1 Tax=Psychroflexus sp. ALD_RP9 TaxID=2777186 RepID=UPI001A8CB394|nr:helical backbone metal receptor [Psychroflexus sp. ALD_RP9]QSS97593.1 ABC transporter substrate-binding protein [Psychroflexus sp. ALD_RP9]